jgi:CRISPR-associated protein (TIGR03984 family)
MSDADPIAYTIAHFPGISAEDLLGKAGGHVMEAALLFTPDQCMIARVDGTALVIFDSIAGKLRHARVAEAYEIRAFGPTAELGWVRRGETGDATLLADGPPGIDTDLPKLLEVLDRRYRIWGEPPKAQEDGKASATKPPSGWTTLSAGRIEPLYLPFGNRETELALIAREYVVRAKDGNAVVLFERLVGFAPAVATGEGEAS